MKKSVRNIIIGLVIVISLANIIYSRLKPLEVETITIEANNLVDYVEENGKVISEKEVLITPKTSGQIMEIVKANGDAVKKGDLILKLDSEGLEKQLAVLSAQIKAYDEEKSSSLVQLKNQIHSQSIQVSEMKSQRDFAKDTFDQMTALYEQGSLSENDWKASKQAYETANSTYQQIQSGLSSLNAQYKSIAESSGTLMALQSQYDALELQLKDTNIYANADGILTEFNVKIGEFVSPQLQIGKIIDPENYLVEAYVLTDDVSTLKVKDEVLLILKQNGLDHEFKGEIQFISKSAEEKISSLGLVEQRMKVLIRSNELSKVVKAGYEVKTKFISEFKDEALAVPKTSIFKIEDGSYVYAIRDGKAIQLKIETGIDTDSEISIESGINPGEVIIKNYKIDGLTPNKKVTSKSSN